MPIVDSIINISLMDLSSCSDINDAFSHTAVMACTSGSTGLPKSICLSHAMLSYTIKGKFFGSGHTFLNFSSMYWISGILAMLRSALTVTRIFTTNPFSPDSFFDFVAKYKVNYHLTSSLDMCVDLIKMFSILKFSSFLCFFSVANFFRATTSTTGHSDE